MSELNKVFIIGNLTKDVEIRFTPKGIKVTNLRLALHRRFITKENEQKEETTFITAVVYDKQAETCEKYLKKGDKILVEGRLFNRAWQDDKGQKFNLIEIKADRIQFINLKHNAPSENNITEKETEVEKE